MDHEKKPHDELRAAREEFDSTVAAALREACRIDPTYLKTYADFTRQTLVDAPKALQ